MNVNLISYENNNFVQMNKDGTTPTLFVDLVVQHIFSFLAFSDLDTCRHVCKHWQKLAPVAFGVREWKKYFDIDVKNASCSPISQEEIGKSMMVLIPAAMSKHEFTTLMYKKGIKTADPILSSETISNSYWIEVPIEPTEVAYGVSYQDRISIAKNMGRSTPTIMEALVAHGVYQVVTKGYLNKDSVLCEGSYELEYEDQFWGKGTLIQYPFVSLSAVEYNVYNLSVFCRPASEIYNGFSKVLPIKRYA